MKILKFLAIALIAMGMCASAKAQTPPGGYGPTIGGGGGGGLAPTPGVTGPPTNGLIGQYEILSTDSVSALADTSGQGNNGTGTVGTAPTIGANGGVVCNGAGAASLPAALNGALTIGMYLTVSSPGSPTQFYSPLGGNGNGATSHAIQIIFNNSFSSGSGVGSNDATADNINNVQTWSNFSFTDQTTQGFMGNGSFILTMAAADHFYLNGVETGYITQGTSAGKQTTGNYQVCGAAAGSGLSLSTYGNNMTVRKLYFYNRVLTAPEIAQLNQWMNLDGTAVAAAPSLVNASAVNPNLIIVGDSITNGHGILAPYGSAMKVASAQSYVVNQVGVTGERASNIASNTSYGEGVWCNPNAQDNLIFLFLGTNDVALGGTPASAIKALGTIIGYWKTNCPNGRVLVATMLSRASNDTNEQAITTSLLNNWQAMGASGLVDFMSDPNIGATGADANTTYFSDGVHPTQGGSYDDLTPIAQRAVNRATGNLSWATATTYSSGAPAATSITAATEATNTVTITSTLNPPVGACVVIAGVTPAGYNSPTSGCWFVLTTGASSFTYWNTTSGLGAGSVFGTAAVPLQKDQDVYAILGGSSAAQNFTLESCLGYSGQSIYLMVTDTNAWTVTPFVSGETINGQTTLTTPAATNGNHPVVQLKAIPGAVGTGGCTWQASLQ